VQSKRRGEMGHFVDPTSMLKLYNNIPLMPVSNNGVANGHANGTRVLLKGVILKDGITTDSILIDGKECQAVDACDVNHFLCASEWNPSKLFKIEAKKLTSSVKALDNPPKHRRKQQSINQFYSLNGSISPYLKQCNYWPQTSRSNQDKPSHFSLVKAEELELCCIVTRV
jgi:hypothetical protein